MHQQTSPPCPQFHLHLSVLHTDTDLHTSQTTTWRDISKFSTCFWHNIMLSQKLPEIKDYVIKSTEVIIWKRNWKPKDLWLWMQVISDSQTIVFPKSYATQFPPASLRATKICYFSTCTWKHSISIAKKNGSDYLLQKDASQMKGAETPPIHTVSLYGLERLYKQTVWCKSVDLQWYLFSKHLLKSLFFSKIFSWRKQTIKQNY